MQRIWENVYDWEHLAHLHKASFAACDLIERGSWGWRAKLMLSNREAQIIELRTDVPAGCYVTTTIEGKGAGTQIRVELLEVAPQLTEVAVEFQVPETDPARLFAIGAAYASVYERLWDEDEAMMRERERLLAAAVRPDAASLDLGSEHDVRQALPIDFELAGRPFRLVLLGETIVAHSTICPHWLGPLGDSAVFGGTVQCPWHGYRFDVASGRCQGRPELMLEPAPAIKIDGERVRAVRRDKPLPLPPLNCTAVP